MSPLERLKRFSMAPKLALRQEAREDGSMANRKIQGIYAITLLALMLIHPGAFAQERQKVSIDEILAAATAEKETVERDYRARRAAERRRAQQTGERTIAVKLGDGLAPEDRELADRGKFRGSDRSYREKEAVARLEREWKEVNKALQRVLTEDSKN